METVQIQQLLTLAISFIRNRLNQYSTFPINKCRNITITPPEERRSVAVVHVLDTNHLSFLLLARLYVQILISLSILFRLTDLQL
jgi:hypothetical protein